MSGKVQIRLAVLAALAALVAVLVPSGLALGDHPDDPGPGTAPAGIIYLSLGKQPSSDVITFGELQQSIPTKKNDCTAVDALNPGDSDSILVVEEINALSLGEGKNHIGTLGPNDGSGEPCALASADNGTLDEDGNPTNETISVKIGEAAGDVLLDGFSVDVRLKGTGATVVASFYDESGAQLNGDGTDFSFTQAADSGPDSADNYRWTVEPGFEFFEVRFEATIGSFALGGGDESDDAGAFDTLSFASQFRAVEVFEGQITCGDTHTIQDATIDPDIEGVLTVHSMDTDTTDSTDNFITAECLLKLFSDDVGDPDVVGFPSLAFVPNLEDTAARYTMMVTLENQPVTTDPTTGAITSLQAQYNLNGDLSFGPEFDMQSCNGQPIDEADADNDGTIDPAYLAYWQQENPVQATDGAGNLIVDSDGNPVALLPGSETICFYSSGVTLTGVADFDQSDLPEADWLDLDGDGTPEAVEEDVPVGTEIWKFYFEDDPGMFM